MPKFNYFLKSKYKEKLDKIIGKKHKYSAKKSKCLSDHYHPSVLEADCCNALLADLQAGKIKGYQVHKGFDLEVNGMHICRHYPDFLVDELDGTQTVRESKGAEMADWVMKKNLFVALFPHIKYFVVKRGR